MIDPPVWLTNISPKILKFRFSLHMVKDDWAPQYDWPLSHLKFHIKFILSLHMVEDDWPPPAWLPNISPKILKLRFSLHIVKDDWPPWTTQYLT